MTRKQRIVNQLRGLPVDRIPMLGGWILGVRNLAVMAGISVEEYLAYPEAGLIQAHRALDVDGMVNPLIPRDSSQIRTGSVQDTAFAHLEPEAIKEIAASIPATREEVAAEFDRSAEETTLRTHFLDRIRMQQEIVVIPNLWNACPEFSLHFKFGYRALLMAVAMYPEELGRVYWHRGIIAHERNKLVAAIIRELDLPPVMFFGGDFCSNQGPMCSPEYLRKHLWPHVRYALEPLIQADIRAVAHCDGNIMPVAEDLVQAGFSGFQGFQYELGVDPYELRKLRGPRGEVPIFFAGLSVSRTLPYGSLDEIKEEIDYFIDFTDGGKGLFLFTSNTITVEVPPENVLQAYRYMRSYDPRAGRRPGRRRLKWPWGEKHGLFGQKSLTGQKIL